MKKIICLLLSVSMILSVSLSCLAVNAEEGVTSGNCLVSWSFDPFEGDTDLDGTGYIAYVLPIDKVTGERPIEDFVNMCTNYFIPFYECFSYYFRKISNFSYVDGKICVEDGEGLLNGDYSVSYGIVFYFSDNGVAFKVFKTQESDYFYFDDSSEAYCSPWLIPEGMDLFGLLDDKAYAYQSYIYKDSDGNTEVARGILDENYDVLYVNYYVHTGNTCGMAFKYDMMIEKNCHLILTNNYERIGIIEGNVEEVTYYYYTTEGKGDPYKKLILEYDDDGNTVNEKVYIYFSGLYIPTYEYKMIYDKNGNCTKETVGYYNGTGYVEVNQYDFEFDENGYLVKETLSTIVGEEPVLVEGYEYDREFEDGKVVTYDGYHYNYQGEEPELLDEFHQTSVFLPYIRNIVYEGYTYEDGEKVFSKSYELTYYYGILVGCDEEAGVYLDFDEVFSLPHKNESAENPTAFVLISDVDELDVPAGRHILVNLNGYSIDNINLGEGAGVEFFDYHEDNKRAVVEATAKARVSEAKRNAENLKNEVDEMIDNGKTLNQIMSTIAAQTRNFVNSIIENVIGWIAKLNLHARSFYEN